MRQVNSECTNILLESQGRGSIVPLCSNIIQSTFFTGKIVRKQDLGCWDEGRGSLRRDEPEKVQIRKLFILPMNSELHTQHTCPPMFFFFFILSALWGILNWENSGWPKKTQQASQIWTRASILQGGHSNHYTRLAFKWFRLWMTPRRSMSAQS